MQRSTAPLSQPYIQPIGCERTSARRTRHHSCAIGPTNAAAAASTSDLADRVPRPLARHASVGSSSPTSFSTPLWKQDSSALISALARDSCHNVRPVFLEPGQSLRPVDDTLERFPAWVPEGFRLKPLRRILNEFVQAFVSSSALEGLRNRRTGPPSPGQIDNARSVSLAEPRCGIELETDDIIGGMASSVDHWVSPFAGVDRAETSFEPNILVPAPALHQPALASHSRVPFRCRAPISP
jgi:hypothetical protein